MFLARAPVLSEFLFFRNLNVRGPKIDADVGFDSQPATYGSNPRIELHFLATIQIIFHAETTTETSSENSE